MKKIVGIMLLSMLYVTGAFAGMKYDDGVVLSDEKGENTFKVNGRGKTQLQWDSGKDFGVALNFPEMRLKFGGQFFGGKVTYLTQLDFAKMGVGNDWLLDYYFNYGASDDAAQVRFGRYKPSLYRGYVNSSADLALTSRPYFMGRSIFGMRSFAVSVHNNLSKNVAYNIDLGVAHAGLRVGYNSDNMNGYDEWDQDGGDLRFAVGAAAYMTMNNFLTGGAMKGLDLRAQNYGLDAAVKVSGLAVFAGGYLATSPGVGADAKLNLNWQYYAQGSYKVTDAIGVALRYAGDMTKGAKAGHDISAGVTLFCPETHARSFLNVGAGTVDGNGKAGDAWSFKVTLMNQLTF